MKCPVEFTLRRAEESVRQIRVSETEVIRGWWAATSYDVLSMCVEHSTGVGDPDGSAGVGQSEVMAVFIDAQRVSPEEHHRRPERLIGGHMDSQGRNETLPLGKCTLSHLTKRLRFQTTPDYVSQSSDEGMNCKVRGM